MPDMTKTYISILIDTLKKKEEVLYKLKEETARQSLLLDAEELDRDAFDASIEAKDVLLKRLSGLDDGFMDLYARVQEEMKTHTADYADQVKTAQDLIRNQTDITTELTAMEERNKNKLALYLTKGRQKVKDFKVSSSAAAAYYRNMSGKHQEGDSYFFNRKK